MAKLAEQTGRPEDCVAYMEALVGTVPTLSDEERNLVSAAFKNLISSPRNAWRVLSAGVLKEASSKSKHYRLIVEYKAKVEQEMRLICDRVMRLLDEKLIPGSEGSVQCNVFYWKMKGDYLRYLAEFLQSAATASESRDDVIARAAAAYETATELAKQLPHTNIVRLGLALNYSVFYYEIKGCPQVACRIANETYKQAMKEMHSQQPNFQHNDISVILQLFQDNLGLWQGELDATTSACNPQSTVPDAEMEQPAAQQ